jgi:SH3 domain protein
MKFILCVFSICLFGLCASEKAWSESAWVSDEFEITLRSGPSTSNAIQLMVGSGTALEILERDTDAGYTRVRTGGGTEGWVLSRYLMPEPSAREQLQTLSGQLSSANTKGSSLTSQLAAIRGEHGTATKRIETLEREKSQLEQELAEIKRTAANVLRINDENTDLHKQVMDAGIRMDILEQENRELSGQTTRYWFMTGGLVLLVGIILGLWLPRIRWQRRSGYDRF